MSIRVWVCVKSSVVPFQMTPAADHFPCAERWLAWPNGGVFTLSFCGGREVSVSCANTRTGTEERDALSTSMPY